MSTTPRLIVRSDLMLGAPLALSAEHANYLFKVLRLKVGDDVRVFNGRDGEWLARITEIMRSAGFLKVEKQLRQQAQMGDVELMFAPLKKSCTDFVIEKATELGVSIIKPILTARTQAKTVRVERLSKIAEEAAEQTERLDVPLIEPAVHLIEAVGSMPEGRYLIYCDELGDDDSENWGGDIGTAPPMLDAIKDLAPGSVTILVGPEGGFTPEERERLRNIKACIPVSLGPRILRAETAAITALALWQALKGDWNLTSEY